MQDCCCNIYDIEFDYELAKRDLHDYLTRGPKKNTQKLLQVLEKINLKEFSLLDIGSGIGVFVFELFNKRIKSAVHVEISKAYSEVFRTELQKRDLTSKVKCFRADFLDIHKQIENTDVVILDKAICCYKDYDELVRISVGKANKWYAYIIPRDTWWVKLVHTLESLWEKLRGKHFTTYIHPVKKIEKIIIERGFKKYNESVQREWLISVFQKC